MLGPLLPWLIGVQVWRTEVRGIRGKESVWSPLKIMTAMCVDLHIYRPQGKVMFSEVFVHEGGLRLEGCLCPEGSPSRGGSPFREG